MNTLGELLSAYAESMPSKPELGPRMERSRIGMRDPIPKELRGAILARDDFRCRWCWSKDNLQLDHVIPWSAGGSDESTNLRTLCGPCNEARSNRVSDAHTVKPKPVTLNCLRCTGEDTDSTEQDAFCLECRRFTPARLDQIKWTSRHFRWLAETEKREQAKALPGGAA